MGGGDYILVERKVSKTIQQGEVMNGKKKFAVFLIAAALVMANLTGPLSPHIYAQDEVTDTVQDQSVQTTAPQLPQAETAAADAQNAGSSESTQNEQMSTTAAAGTQGTAVQPAETKDDSEQVSQPAKEGTEQTEKTSSATAAEPSVEPLMEPAPPAPSIVAYVGSTGFDTLDAAVASIADTGTVKIVGDCRQTDTITIPSGKNITFVGDGNAHTVSIESIPGQNLGKALIRVENGGALTINDPQLTFTRDAQTDENVYAHGLVVCNGTFQLDNGILDENGNQINGAVSREAGVVCVKGDGAVFTMNGGEVRNAHLMAFSGGVLVINNGKFVLNGGTISNFDNPAGQDANSAVMIMAGENNITGDAWFEMNGGTIENNTNPWGAGVMVDGKTFEYRAHMVMNGGTIRNNTGTGWKDRYGGNFGSAGAGMYIQNNAEVTMNGGSIENNKSIGGQGGGIAVNDGYWYAFPDGPNSSSAWPIEQYSHYYPASFTMNGGSISGNSATHGAIGEAGGFGGGIYASTNNLTLNGGRIENNKADEQGGGVYLGAIPYHMHLYNAVITQNTADILGGGVWACPTGDTEVYVTNGVGIFDNISSGAGDDIVSVKHENSNYILTLSDRMLGGGLAQWYKDGGVKKDETNSLGHPDESARYIAGGDNTPFTGIADSKEQFAIKSAASDSAKALAKADAKLFITGNSAARGGGIGSNGGVIMGQKDYDYKLTVTKSWKDKAENALTDDSLKQSVSVYLKVGDTVLDPVTLSADNNWTATFSDLPDPDSLGTVSYSVVENPVPDDFKAQYSQATVNKDKREITIDLSNIYDPAEQPIETPTVSFDITKKWVGDVNVDKVTAHILANGEDTGKTVDITKADGWKTTVKDLPKLDENGNEIQYSISEETVSGYKTSSITGDMANGFEITNTKIKGQDGEDQKPGTNPGENPGNQNPGQKPGNQDQGGQPGNQQNQGNPSGEQSAQVENTTHTVAPQTGYSDHKMIIWAVSVLAGAGACIALYAADRKKRHIRRR